MIYKTTNKQFQLFQDECTRLQSKYGLINWEVNYYLEKLEDNRAEISVNITGRIASIKLNSEWDYKPTNKEIRRTAFHETMELLLWNLAAMIDQRYSLCQDDVEEEVHRIIRTLENIEYGPTI